MADQERPDAVTFDTEALYLRLDRERRDRRITWRQIGRESGIRGVAWITRLGHSEQTRALSADTMAKLLAWLGDTDIGPYIRRQATQ